MKAVWFEDGKASWAELPIPTPREGEALLRLRVAGVCNTDLELLKGYMRFKGVPGHEFVAEVVQCSDASWVGKRVVGEINCSCGVCRFCRAGAGNHCPTRTILGLSGRQGCFADYFTLPVSNLHEVPSSVQDFDAVFTEPLAAACRVLDQVRADRALVVGDGKLGMLVALALKKSGTRVYVRGHHENRMEALRNLSIHRDSGVPFPLVVDCTGNPAALPSILSRVQPGGTLVAKSTYQGTPAFDMTKVAVDEITVVGSRCGPFPKALELLQDSDVSPLLSKMRERVVPFYQALEGIEDAAAGGLLKVVLDHLETGGRRQP